MNILAIESSGRTASACVTRNGEMLASEYVDIGTGHATTLLPLVQKVLTRVGLALTGVDMLAVSVGPGSFTGLRIGVAAVKGLAWAAGIPCIGVSTLAALAAMHETHDGIIVSALDARRGQVYAAVFYGSRQIIEDMALGAGELVHYINSTERHRGRSLLCGDGADIVAAAMDAAGREYVLAPAESRLQNAVGVAKAAERMLAEGYEPISADALNPVYLRVSQAERERMQLIMND